MNFRITFTEDERERAKAYMDKIACINVDVALKKKTRKILQKELKNDEEARKEYVNHVTGNGEDDESRTSLD